MRGYWFLLLETFAATRRPPLHHCYLLAICLPSFFTSTVSSCVIKFPPTHPTHRFPDTTRQGYKFVSTTWSTLTTHFLHLVWVACSYSLIPDTHLIPITSAVYVWTLRLTCVFSWSHTASKLCRWLGGENQRINSPLFYSVIFLQIISFACILSFGLKVFILNLLTQHVLRFPSVGAGSLSLKTETYMR